jgi:hypothetical protein
MVTLISTLPWLLIFQQSMCLNQNNLPKLILPGVVGLITFVRALVGYIRDLKFYHEPLNWELNSQISMLIVGNWEMNGSKRMFIFYPFIFCLSSFLVLLGFIAINCLIWRN